MYKERYDSYENLQYNIMHCDVLKRMDYTGLDKKKYTLSIPPSVTMNYQIREELVQHLGKCLWTILLYIFFRFVGIPLYSSFMYNDFQIPSFA